jgi:hypothetical protein
VSQLLYFPVFIKNSAGADRQAWLAFPRSLLQISRAN